MQYKVYQELDNLKRNYEDTSLEKIDGLKRSQHMVIKMCEYYSDSRYLGTYLGNKKAIGDGYLDVPFYNIVNYRVSLAKTATDLDIKDFQIKSDSPESQVQAMLLNREAYEWMKEAEFSRVLNQMGLTRPKYGGYLVKKTEANGKLNIDVVRWTNVWTDQNNILAGTIVEKHPMSPVDINKKAKVWDNVIEVLKAHKKLSQKNKTNVIDVFEITGEMPVSILKNAKEEEVAETDEYTYSLQHYFVAVLDGQKYLMYSDALDGELTDYYEYLSWEENGYGLGRGVIEDSEEAQVWSNDAVINEYIAMTLAGRVGIKTDSKKAGGNILAHDHGKIYELEDGKDINAFSLAPSGLSHHQNLIEKWRTQANDTAFSYNAVTGEQPPSGTPYSQTVFLNSVATKPFDYKREEWGIHLTKIFDKWVIPFLIKKIKKQHILVSEFSDTELELIDESFAAYRSNKDLVEARLAMQPGDVLDPAMQDELKDNWKKHIKGTGRTRFIEVPADYFKDINCKVTVITTGEQKNKAAIMQSLSEIMKTVVQSWNPQTGEFGILADPTLSGIFREIVEWTNAGISPMSLGTGATPSKPAAGVPSPIQTPATPVTPAAAAM